MVCGSVCDGMMVCGSVCGIVGVMVCAVWSVYLSCAFNILKQHTEQGGQLPIAGGASYL